MTTIHEENWIKCLSRRPKVLIVDDDATIVSLLDEFCRRMGVDTDLCHTAECALEMYSREEQYDAILIDLRLGEEMGGDEVFKRIRRNDDTTPIAIISGFITDSVVNDLMEYGPVTFIKKPINFNNQYLSGFFKSIGVLAS